MNFSPTPWAHRALILCLAAGALGCAGSSLFKSPRKFGKTFGGKQEGPWTYWYEDGTKQAQGHYRVDHQVGPWTYWHENGNVAWQGSFSGSRIEGPSTFRHATGNLRARGLFIEGLESGVWTFWNPAGQLEQQGEYAAGRPTGRWTYYYPAAEGSEVVKADGFRLDGTMVGVWSFWDESGKLFEEELPTPPGYQLVVELWDDGETPRREGFTVDGKPAGRWVTRHRNGARRMTGEFAGGLASGRFAAWTEDGTPIAGGPVEDGRIAGTWKLWLEGQAGERSASEFAAPTRPGAEWSAASLWRSAPTETVVGVWLGELTAPLSAQAGAASAASAGAPRPSARQVAEVSRRPIVPIRAQPWTVEEQENLDFLIALYDDGAAQVKPRRGSRYGGRRRGRSTVSKGDEQKAALLVGKPLPWKELTTGGGERVDTSRLEGSKKLVLVVLRGFAREVCVYCATQTEALANNKEAFDALGAEVMVVYPGSEDRLEAFLQSYRTLTKRGQPPFEMTYDPNFKLVQSLDIEDELAIPTTLIVDEGGIVRYAYVGKSIEDRPPAKDLLAAIEAMNEG